MATKIGPLTFRVDDVSANTDLYCLKKMVEHLHKNFVCDVWLCVNPFSFNTSEGSVYPNPPFKNNPKDSFYVVNDYIGRRNIKIKNVKIVSHGLFHADHSNLQYDAQEMSIVGSCNILGTDIFVPPFNKFNQTTESVCRIHKIRMIKSYDEGWNSLEYEKFDLSKSKLWYFHPWRFTVEEFKKAVKC